MTSFPTSMSFNIHIQCHSSHSRKISGYQPFNTMKEKQGGYDILSCLAGTPIIPSRLLFLILQTVRATTTPSVTILSLVRKISWGIFWVTSGEICQTQHAVGDILLTIVGTQDSETNLSFLPRFSLMTMRKILFHEVPPRSRQSVVSKM